MKTGMCVGREYGYSSDEALAGPFQMEKKYHPDPESVLLVSGWICFRA